MSEPIITFNNRTAKGIANVSAWRGKKGYQEALTQGVEELRSALVPLLAKQEVIYALLDLQNMETAELDRYTCAELKRRFATSERLRGKKWRELMQTERRQRRREP